MKIYYINGMTCQGCVAHVEKRLKKVIGVTSIVVDVEKYDVRVCRKFSLEFWKWNIADYLIDISNKNVLFVSVLW